MFFLKNFQLEKVARLSPDNLGSSEKKPEHSQKEQEGKAPASKADGAEIEQEPVIELRKIPLETELYFIKYFIIILDNFLYVLLIQPILLIQSLVQLIILGRLIKQHDIFIIGNSIIIIVPLLILLQNNELDQGYSYIFDLSFWYHTIRGQSTIKIYGLFMTLEIVDKLIVNFGEYIILQWFWKDLQKDVPIIYTAIAIASAVIQNLLNFVILAVQMLNQYVMYNNDISLYWIMIFITNSMKLKTQVNKKLNKDDYVAQTNQDFRSRFQKIFFLFLIYINNQKGFQWDIFIKLSALFATELFVDWIKHLYQGQYSDPKVISLKIMQMDLKEFALVTRFFSIFQQVDPQFTKKFDKRDLQIARLSIMPLQFKLGFKLGFIVFPYIVLLLKVAIPIIWKGQTLYKIGIIYLILIFGWLANSYFIFRMQLTSRAKSSQLFRDLLKEFA